MSINQQPNNHPDEIVAFYGSFTVSEDHIEPPFTTIKSKFNTIQDWLADMCAHDQPEKSIAKYNFGLFESPDNYTLFLTGTNSYEEVDNKRICIEFQPENIYFPLPKVYHESLNREQLIEKLIADLDQFSKTTTFQTSFFTRANVVRFDTTGHIIWSK